MDLGLSAYDLNIDASDGSPEHGDGGPPDGVRRWRVVDVVGEVDLYVAARLAAYLGEQIDHQSAPLSGVVVDLTGVDFIDSAGLGVLVGAFKRARGAGLAMPLVSTNDSFRSMLSITALDRVLALYNDVEQATRGG